MRPDLLLCVCVCVCGELCIKRAAVYSRAFLQYSLYFFFHHIKTKQNEGFLPLSLHRLCYSSIRLCYCLQSKDVSKRPMEYRARSRLLTVAALEPSPMLAPSGAQAEPTLSSGKALRDEENTIFELRRGFIAAAMQGNDHWGRAYSRRYQVSIIVVVISARTRILILASVEPSNLDILNLVLSTSISVSFLTRRAR